MSVYTDFKARVMGKVTGDGQCVSLIDDNANAYVEALFPGVSWTSVMAPVASAYQLAGKGNSHLQWIANDHNDPSQLPSQGDIMVFGPTPAAGYTNTYANPDGHVGICDSASGSGYALLQQNAPAFGEAVNVTEYSWKFRPCLGWYHPLTPGSVTVTPVASGGHSITLPASTGPWHLYKPGGPYNPNNPANVKGLLWPSKFGALTYPIDASLGNGIYRITSKDFGQGDLWTNGSSVVIK